MSKRVTGAKAIGRRLRRISKNTREAMVTATAANALELETELKRTIQGGSRTGRVYLKGKTGRKHVASAPGEPPASDTGQLARHIKHKILDGGTEATVGIHDHNRVKYALDLEFGTMRTAARPFFFPTFERLKPKFKRRYKAAAQRAIKK